MWSDNARYTGEFIENNIEVRVFLILLRVKAFTNGRMGENTKEVGKIIKCTVMEFLHGRYLVWFIFKG